MRHRAVKFLLLIILVNLSGCGSLSYYFEQSIPGHMGLMFKMREIDVLLNQDIQPKLKNKLERVLEIRQFATEQLLLPENDSYRYYADLERPYVTWNVSAAPEFSLKPKTWCYFIIGCAVYRGYFNEEDATAEAEKLSAQGLDVHVGGATAYSTLGFFTDPVLNTMVKWRDHDLAGIIFHELSHQILYIKNDTAFNEAFATSVQIIGLISWMLEHQPEMVEEYLVSLKRAEKFRQLKRDTRNKLKRLYEEDVSDEEKRKRKKDIFNQMENQYQQLKVEWGKGVYDYWFKKPLNNARLLSDAAYWKHVPAFLAIFFESNRDWQTFYDRCEEISDLAKDSRDQTLSTLTETRPITLPEVLEHLQKKAI